MDISPNDCSGNLHLPSAVNPGCEGDVCGILPMATDPLISSGNAATIGSSQPFEQVNSESMMQPHCPWSPGLPSLQADYSTSYPFETETTPQLPYFLNDPTVDPAQCSSFAGDFNFVASLHVNSESSVYSNQELTAGIQDICFIHQCNFSGCHSIILNNLESSLFPLGSCSDSPPKILMASTQVFPAGLRVLAVDNDHTHLQALERKLKKCNYKVTTTMVASHALDILRKGKSEVDMVISDVNLPDMDGYEFLKHVGQRMNIPVVGMYVKGEACSVMKGVVHGACVCLLKPVTKKDLLIIWQHVFRNRMQAGGIEGQESSKELALRGIMHAEGSGVESSDVIEKARHGDGEEAGNREPSGSDSSSVKKARMVWTPSLHEKFLEAVEQIGAEKATPKKILELMAVEDLKREHVASHWQKFRLNMRRRQEKPEENAVSGGGPQLMDISPNDCSGNLHLPSAVNPGCVSMQNNMVMYESNIFPGHNFQQIHNHGANHSCEGDVCGILPMATDPLISSGNAATIGSSQPFEQVNSESMMQPHCPWSPGLPSLQADYSTSYPFETETTPQLPYFLNDPTVDPAQCSSFAGDFNFVASLLVNSESSEYSNQEPTAGIQGMF